MVIVTVALNRLTTGFADRVLQRCYSLLLRRGRAGHVEDFFLQNCAVQIVHAVAERDLRQRESKTHPIGGKGIDVIEINPADCQIAKLFKCRRAFYVGKDAERLSRFECERNESGESARLVLQLPKLPEMIHTLSKSFDVAVEHRARAAAAHGVP